ncbi:nitronate monooxygenase [Ignatzschineria ureiclastica]|uniref:Nitronate monooxygenase n=1 Tax=Ignatzschineria ureiclastica TaxID=472582 RepID=A0A2U2AGU4_9GAMM|nr:nitronate monooxygenase [Ignatzschineria ureiclastica]PWD81886.1 nitronate monooxygenase [Ignatzschineria ureiclastica]GGZ91226.1 nitronate monooxygenase [Ignatzschineria ureiclastica]
MTIKKPAKLPQLLGIEYPIVQVPLYHGDSTELVAAISNEGGLGMIAGGLLTPEALQHEIEAVRALTEKPFGVNLLIANKHELAESRYQAAIKAIEGFAGAAQLEVDALNTEAWELSPIEDLIDILIEMEVAVVSFSFGIPDETNIALLKDAGIKIMGHSTHMVEALLWEEKEVDIHLLQGSESGGMRGTFVGDPQRHSFSASTLVTQANQVLEQPFIVSGGVYNKSSFASLIIQGADGVGIGTAFMLTPESGLTEVEADKILSGNEYDTILTAHWTGIMGRCFSNQGAQALNRVKKTTLPFPEQLFLIHAATIDELESGSESEEFQPIWASVNAPFCQRLSVGALMASLVN